MPLRKTTAPKNAAPKVNKASRSNLKKDSKGHLWILLALSIIGAYIRLEPVIFDTVHFSFDQGLDISLVRRLVVDHKFTLIGRYTGLQGVFLGPLWTWLLAVPYLVSGGSPTANEIFMSLIGIGSIWASYWLVKKMFTPQIALLSAGFVALSTQFIVASQVVLSPYALTLIMLPYLWCLWEVIQKNNDAFLPWLALLVGLSFQFEIAFGIVLVPATLVVLGAFGFFTRIGKHRLLSLIIFAATFLPQVVFDLRHDFLISRAVLSYFNGSNTSLGSEGVGLLGRAGLRAGSLWQDYATSVAMRSEATWLALLVTCSLAIGWYRALRDKASAQLRFGAMLMLLILCVYLGFALYPGPVWAWYRAGMPIVFMLLVAIAWSHLLPTQRGRWLVSITILLLVWFGLKPSQYINRALHGDEGTLASVKTQKNVIDMIFRDAGDEPFDLYVYTPPVYIYVWDHELYWYAKANYTNYPVDYGYQRGTAIHNTTYLVIEPDEYTSRIDGWKGNLALTGKPVKIWNLPSGIRIEKWEVMFNEE